MGFKIRLGFRMRLGEVTRQPSSHPQMGVFPFDTLYITRGYYNYLVSDEDIAKRFHVDNIVTLSSK